MHVERINALATAVIAFVTILAIMGGMWYNLNSSGLQFRYIALLELLFVVAVWIFISWIQGGMEG